MSSHFSTLIQTLKLEKLRLSPSLSSYGIFKSLDSFYERALLAIGIASPFYLESFAANFLAQYTGSRIIYVRNKVFGEPYLFLFLYSTAPLKERIKYLMQAELNREFLHTTIKGFVDDSRMFLHEAQQVSPNWGIVHHFMTRYHIEDFDIGYGEVASAVFWFSQCVELRKDILQRYHRLILQLSVRRFYKTPNLISLEEIFLTGMLAAYSALNRFDYRKGAFTSYLQSWVSNSIRYIPADTQAGSVDSKTLSLDDPKALSVVNSLVSNSENSLNNLESSNTLTFPLILRRLDPKGLLRFTLHIEETLTAVEVQRLQSVAV